MTQRANIVGRIPPADKVRWVRAAQARNQTLWEFIQQAVGAEADRRLITATGDDIPSMMFDAVAQDRILPAAPLRDSCGPDAAASPNSPGPV